MNGISKKWTAWSLYREAFTDIGWIENSELHIQSLAIVNRAVEDVLAQIFPAVYVLYLTSDPIVVSPAGNYSASGTGTWTAATKTLTFATMNTPFQDSDIDNTVTFRIGSNTYTGVILSQAGGTAVVLTGAFLPAADGTVNYVIVVTTRVSTLVANISALSISNLEGARITLESSSLDRPVSPVSVDDLLAWRNDDTGTPRIVFAREGNSLLFRVRSTVSSLGSLKLHYPRLNYAATADGDAIDLPDGGPARLGLLRVKSIIGERLNRELNLGPEIADALKDVFQAAQLTLNEEEVKTKVAALT